MFACIFACASMPLDPHAHTCAHTVEFMCVRARKHRSVRVYTSHYEGLHVKAKTLH